MAEGSSVCRCEYCGKEQTLPKTDDEHILNMLNRANYFRQKFEFDKAIEIYEQLLNNGNEDAEVYWSLVLCRYGIEYVDDPKTSEKKPTCHRMQYASILEDADYLMAIKGADTIQKNLFEKEAGYIAKTQKEILEISNKEDPFDIFICYKETDELGNRTEDSALAQELYYELKKKGYRIFFARKTLESRLGTEYEPIIFAALNSAKVMIVLGTKAEHFNAVWVRNEWSRFIHMSKDASKTVIPAYRGMSPYELPAELSVFQSQDMSKIGFMQDLTDGIERCMRVERNNESPKNEHPQFYGTASLERLLQNGATYLRLSNYSFAKEVYTTVTKEYPEEHRGWWGLIVCETRNFSDVMLDQTELNVWLCYVKQLASPKEFQELENQYVDYTKKVSQLAAIEDMKAVNSIISQHNSEIKNIENYIQTINVQIEERENEWKRQDEFEHGRIKNAKKDLSDSKNEYSEKVILIGIGGILLLAGVLVLCIGGWGILWGLLIGFAGFGLLSVGFSDPSFDTISDREGRARTTIREAKKARVEDKTQLDQDVESFRQSIVDAESDIAILNEKIFSCRRYLELGKDKISELLFSQKCEAFGVSKSFDSQIQEYRNVALNIS